MKYITISIFAICVGWIVWPYYAVHDLVNAIRDGDQVTLEQRIEWKDIRQGLRDALNAMYLARIVKDRDSALASSLTAVLGPAIIDRTVDAYVTAGSIANLMRARRMKFIASLNL